MYFTRGWDTGANINGCTDVKSVYRCPVTPRGNTNWQYYDWGTLRWQVARNYPDDIKPITREEIIAMHPKNSRCVWPHLLRGYK